MMCAPPAARGPIRPSDLETHSTSGYCPADKQWRWAWKSTGDVFRYLYRPGNAAAVSYPAGAGPLCRRVHPDRHPACKQLLCSHRQELGEHVTPRWGNRFKQPALFLTARTTPRPSQYSGLTGQGPALKALQTTLADMREIILIPSVGHTPPEERPEAINAIVLKFLKDIGFQLAFSGHSAPAGRGQARQSSQ